MTIPLSILDLAPISAGQTVGDSFDASVALAQTAERHGYRRVWYAEHHNMPTVASSATSVLIGHVASRTSSIRLGAGGIMLPNHAPLTIAEQFGTLEVLYPGRIDLGLGRAPGSDQATMRAMRRDPTASDRFPEDVLELQGYLGGRSRVPGVQAVPTASTAVPLFILGSSLFGAQLAAALGLPFAFASHFSPDSLVAAVDSYRREFRPSEQASEPYVLAGVNVVASDDEDDARAQFAAMRRARVRMMIARGVGAADYSDAQIDEFLATAQGTQLAAMTRYSAVGTGIQVRRQLEEFASIARADELITAHASMTVPARLRSVALTADAMALAPV